MKKISFLYTTFTASLSSLLFFTGCSPKVTLVKNNLKPQTFSIDLDKHDIPYKCPFNDYSKYFSSPQFIVRNYRPFIGTPHRDCQQFVPAVKTLTTTGDILFLSKSYNPPSAFVKFKTDTGELVWDSAYTYYQDRNITNENMLRNLAPSKNMDLGYRYGQAFKLSGFVGILGASSIITTIVMIPVIAIGATVMLLALPFKLLSRASKKKDSTKSKHP